jgi:hypothetical protein
MRRLVARCRGLANYETVSKIAQYSSVVIGRPDLRDRLHGIFSGIYNFGTLHEFLAHSRANLLIITTKG